MGAWGYGPLDGDAQLGWMMSEFSPGALKPITKASHRLYPGPRSGNKLNVIAELRVAAYAYVVLSAHGLLDWVDDEPVETGLALAERYREVLNDDDDDDDDGAFASWTDSKKARATFAKELEQVLEATEKVRNAPGVAQRVAAI